MNRNLIYGMLANAIMLSGCSSGGTQSPTATTPTVPVATVNAGDAVVYTEYPAKIEGQNDIEIRTQVAGILEKIYVSEGAYVEKGAPLFQIDARPYREAYNNAEGELLAVKAGVVTAKLEVDKLTPLVQSKVVSAYQLKTAQAAYEAALAREKQAAAKVGNAKITLGFATITAPVSGYIGRLFKKTGSLLAPSDTQPLSYLSDNREVHAYFSIGEADFVTFKNELKGASIDEKLKHAAAVNMLLSGGTAYSQTGVLDMVDAAFDKNTGAITLRATFPNKGGLLRSGNSARIKLALKQSGVIRIPQSATFEMQDKTFAFIVDQNSKARQAALTISGSTGNTYYICGGLKDGDRLVLKGLESLKDGTVVKPERSNEKLASN
ncbi:efflux RND transporter periplasmic adaptor subunit [Chitinophaga pinensis]|uniref:Efflux transporter, RND family, MFP subunit n=1 Tax=Chitinophaga pinensis (strain ATCC 43595 / DSM 2588 / LMG 13176 / NBRC 15968 / NCIMB 11800 / UQM 2034) TaxID=485918 RepID=A0A979G477_CHIPD|nr:efflux RND transporter periplasmic adaptor subunit [Chitinophaga pinensis]ACU60495.1 efflux transporter, RND family, MFP subunit [Chitinophaga pinensis DSM 2588]